MSAEGQIPEKGRSKPPPPHTHPSPISATAFDHDFVFIRKLKCVFFSPEPGLKTSLCRLLRAIINPEWTRRHTMSSHTSTLDKCTAYQPGPIGSLMDLSLSMDSMLLWPLSKLGFTHLWSKMHSRHSGTLSLFVHVSDCI